MKFSKADIKKILFEELNNPDSALLSAIGSLAQKIESLDVSIDYLAGAVTGENPAALGYAQNVYGRFARRVDPKGSRVDEIADIIEEGAAVIECLEGLLLLP